MVRNNIVRLCNMHVVTRVDYITELAVVVVAVGGGAGTRLLLLLMMLMLIRRCAIGSFSRDIV